MPLLNFIFFRFRCNLTSKTIEPFFSNRNLLCIVEDQSQRAKGNRQFQLPLTGAHWICFQIDYNHFLSCSSSSKFSVLSNFVLILLLFMKAVWLDFLVFQIILLQTKFKNLILTRSSISFFMWIEAQCVWSVVNHCYGNWIYVANVMHPISEMKWLIFNRNMSPLQYHPSS